MRRQSGRQNRNHIGATATRRTLVSDTGNPDQSGLPPQPGEGEAIVPGGRPARSGLLIFCPHRLVEHVTHVTAADLIAGGIEGVILDLDNTLVRWAQEDIASEVLAWLE